MSQRVDESMPCPWCTKPNWSNNYSNYCKVDIRKVDWNNEVEYKVTFGEYNKITDTDGIYMDIRLYPTSHSSLYTGHIIYKHTYTKVNINATLKDGALLEFSVEVPNSHSVKVFKQQATSKEYSSFKSALPYYRQTSHFTLIKECPSEVDTRSRTSSATVSKSGSSSCVVIDAQRGILITNHHVVEGAKSLYIKVEGKQYAVDVIAMEESSDLALLKIKSTTPSTIKSISFSITANLGDKVYAAGYPKVNDLGLSLKVTDGIVSSLSFMENSSFIQISCPITNGNSGGALLNERGGIIGITQSGYRPDMNTENINGAVKSLTILSFLQANEVSYSLVEQQSVDFNRLHFSVLPLFVQY